MIKGQRNGNANFWWAVHNIIAHPFSEVLYWLRLYKLSDWIHDQTVPKHDITKEGR